jgi:hypothetical protein
VVVKSQQERPFWLYTYAPPRSDIRVHREGCLHGQRKLIRGVWTGPLTAEQLAMLPQHTLKWCYFCRLAGRL